jgi:hypothetical protein
MNSFCQKDVWLGETGSGFDGGTHGLSDRYASGLLWLNKLGLTARHNYKVCMVGFNKGQFRKSTLVPCMGKINLTS